MNDLITDTHKITAVVPGQTERDLLKSVYGSNRPMYGDLVLDTKNNVLYAVLGNSLQDNNKTIWCVSWDENAPHYGARGYPLVKNLEFKETLDTHVLVDKMTAFAKAGHAHAMFWLGWWYEGVNHPKSTWYYIASMRADNEEHRWVFERLYGDTHYGAMCENVEYPSLEYLSEISEFNDFKVSLNWSEAIEKAEAAIHKPATEEQYADAAAALQQNPNASISDICESFAITQQGFNAYRHQTKRIVKVTKAR
ncbi:hypothetical protein [Hydromonas duriensis]|uniref:Uncharacterized protein n=1 Tax=Hydromonas duriensis TaxID=1527608 RepID=A0A4R6Y4T3_9BURK|nr:hypothetical protein [Hydromonas duriensis]TDR28944.1 hypothetical protein DFR44_13013 [Hydromonas duriensis]